MPAVSHKNELGWLNRPLAIVGMACRLPGADGLEAYWDLLQRGGYSVERMPDAKLDRRLYFDPEKGKRGKTYADVGGFVTERELDWGLLPFSKTEAQDYDECHLNLCEVAARSFADAGYSAEQLVGRRVGVFVGHSGGSTLGGELAFRALAREQAELLTEVQQAVGSDLSDAAWQRAKREFQTRMEHGRPQRSNGKPFVEASYAAGLISNAFDLDGPFMSIDAACASSLVALALGANSLHSGQAEMALIGGASFNKTDSLILFSNAQSCSAIASRPFDENADGLISSEGYVTILVKTLQRAEADGDKIHAVIRGLGMASDGRGRSLWAPRKEGQCTAIERAYSEEIRPDRVQMVEAHATSTQVGDATEMEALNEFYSRHLPPGSKLPVGSVKSNIGHTLETAGLAGLVKTVLAIQNQAIPPTVNVQQLSKAIPWEQMPLYAVTEREPWDAPDDGGPRRGAVNAFGIGGLNMHVVVDEYQPELTLSAAPRAFATSGSKAAEQEPIAVIGRGVIVPGAHDVAALKRAASGALGSYLAQAPSSRLRTEYAHSLVSGFVTDFEYDWRRHKVPPKQISQANPLQFMLLDAAEQAFHESQVLSSEFDRQRTAVVVGSSFGGDFGNALFVGLRLPEIREHLREILEAETGSRDFALECVSKFVETFEKMHPAILDETGSFTSSTLASRLSKTYDLMGGAMAVDAGDASGSAALFSSVGLLRSGAASHVLCAAAQRALDHAAIENLWQLGRLPGSTGSADDGYSVSEGVALVLLKPLAAAERDGNKVLATIGDSTVGSSQGGTTPSIERATRFARAHDASHNESSRWIGAVGVRALDGPASEVVGVKLVKSTAIDRIGHLQAAQPILDLILKSEIDEKETPVALVDHSISGQCYVTRVQSPNTNVSKVLPTISKPRTASRDTVSISGGELVPASQVALPEQGAAEVYRFGAPTKEQLVQELKSFSGESATGSKAAKQFFEDDLWRAAIVSNASEAKKGALKLTAQMGNSASRVPLGEQGLFWSDSAERTGSNEPKISGIPGMSRGRPVVWMFPGQGSQYPGMLKELAQHRPSVAPWLQKADDALSQVAADLGQPFVAFAEMAWHPSGGLGQDVWTTQAAMLIADWTYLQLLSERGFVPDVVAGHSYGEFAAMLAAGCWDLPTALRATWYRCQAVKQYSPAGCAMMSVQADRTRLEQAILEADVDVHVSHVNAPTQTVAGGRQAEIARLAEFLDDEQVGSRILAVPTAFHTPALSEAVQPFRESLDAIQIQPPQRPFLSNVSNQYEADPHRLRDLLASQLASPLNFVGIVERIVADGAQLMVEVGPQQVLSKLVRQSDNGLHTIATDHPRRSRDQMSRAEVVLEMCSDRSSSQATAAAESKRSSVQSAPIHFDATEARRSRVRSSIGQRPNATVQANEIHTSASKPVHFDATDSRRSNARSSARVSTPAFSSSNPSVENTPRDSSLGEPSVSEAGFNNRSRIEKFLIDFVVEQTGYPAEIIEPEWDLEADLGIDSIKKAQLFGELREFFDLEQTQAKLDQFQTLTQIVDLLEATPGKADWLKSEATVEGSQVLENETPVASTDTVQASLHPHMQAEQGQEVQVTPEENQNDFAQFLVDFVVEQTGYPPEVVELDADLEADLGIDSIKKAQLLGEIREMFDLTIEHSPDKMTQDPFRTLRDIQKALSGAVDFGSSVSKLGPMNSSEFNHRAAEEEYQLSSSSVASEEPQLAKEPSSDSKAEKTIGQPVSGGSLEEKPGSIRLPSAELSNSGEYEVDPEFLESAQENLKSFVARRVGVIRMADADETPQQLNGVQSSYSQDVELFATSMKASSETVRKLDDWLSRESRWHIGFPTNEQRDSRGDGDVQWLAEWLPPVALRSLCAGQLGWLARAGEVAGAEILLPGSTVAQGSRLAVGGFALWGVSEGANGHSLQTLIQLRDRMREFQALPVQEVLKKLQSQSEVLHTEAWVVLLNPDLGEAIHVSFGDGLFSTQHCAFEDLCLKPTAGAALRIGFDSQRQNLVFSNSDGTRLKIEEVEAESTVGNAAADQTDFSEHVGSVHRSQDRSTVQSAAGPARVASRYELTMAPAARNYASHPNRQPEWFGSALVVGDNPTATQLVARLRSVGVECEQLSGKSDPFYLAEKFSELSSKRTIPHLFITSPLDSAAKFGSDFAAWERRREAGLMSAFWLCQRWHSHVLEHGLAYQASLVGLTSLGGDFGFGRQVESIEGGGLSGMLKSILIESWTQGIRPMVVKVLDTHPSQSASETVGHIWEELAYPSYDTELSYASGTRQVIRALPRSLAVARQKSDANALETNVASRVKYGGNWVFTGGARGITAYVAEEMALRYGLKLHLIGKSPVPTVDPSWRDLGAAETKKLKAKVMTGSRGQGRNPVKVWQNVEKALEIDATVRKLQELGIEAHYHSCDVSNLSDLEATLAEVRRISGPIDGVLHGAGVGKDSRFDRKQPEKVNECVAAKVDGALALMSATQEDPLQFFVGFGSISGRFGANGHTDYSLANELLCKQLDWFQSRRPNVRAVGFHWHAWGDIGMATKPETKLALEMIDMQFMPAKEGLQHLIDELESDSQASEVLITDDRYFRTFYPSETVVSAPGEKSQTTDTALTETLDGFPLLDQELPVAGKDTKRRRGDEVNRFGSKVDPVKDPFLAEHTLGGRPLFPFVVATELLHEAARAAMGTQRVRLTEVQAHTPLRFFTDEPRELMSTVSRENNSDGARYQLSLLCDFKSRGGRLLENDRLHFSASAQADSENCQASVHIDRKSVGDVHLAAYPDADAEFYVGSSLQRLRRFALGKAEAVGWISAPALIELSGSGRAVEGWSVPSAAMDACLFATGILAWDQVASGSALPVKIGQISLGRLPYPGEACEVHIALKGSNVTSDGRRNANFDFTLYGVDGAVLLDAQRYEVQWMDASTAKSSAAGSRKQLGQDAVRDA